MDNADGEPHDDEGAEDGTEHRADALLEDDAEVDVEAERGHGHAEQLVGELDEARDEIVDKRQVRTDGAGQDEAAHEPRDRHRHLALARAVLLAEAARLEDADDDGDRREQQDAGELGDDGAVRADGTGRTAGGDGMRDLVQAQAGHDAELRVREAEEWLQADLNEREERAENGDDGDGEDRLVSLGLDGA